MENSKTLSNISKSPLAPDSDEIVITVVISPYNFLNSRKTVSTPAGLCAKSTTTSFSPMVATFSILPETPPKVAIDSNILS